MRNDVELIQQGDVLFYRQAEGTKLPENAVPMDPDPRGAVFAEGEATGHYHGTSAEGIQTFRAGNEMWALVEETKEVTHQEHGKVILEPGLYFRGIVQEVDPFSREVHDVQD